MSGDNLGDKLKGVAKETAGKVTRDDDLEKEGESQQKKAQSADEAERLEEAAAEKRQEQAGHAGQEAKRR